MCWLERHPHLPHRQCSTPGSTSMFHRIDMYTGVMLENLDLLKKKGVLCNFFGSEKHAAGGSLGAPPCFRLSRVQLLPCLRLVQTCALQTGKHNRGLCTHDRLEALHSLQQPLGDGTQTAAFPRISGMNQPENPERAGLPTTSCSVIHQERPPTREPQGGSIQQRLRLWC